MAIRIGGVSKTGCIAGLLLVTSLGHAFDMQGHRGARGLMPENTLPGFAATLGIGVTTLELDLAVTADSVVVVSHNPRVEPALARDADGEWLQQASPPINDMDLATVREYDVGRLNPDHKYAKRYPGQQGMDGVPIPTLAEVFELVERSGNETVAFNIETKISPERPGETLPPKEFAAAVIELVRLHGLEKRVTIQSFDWRVLQETRQMAPEIRTAYLTVNQRWLSNLQIGVEGASPWLGGLDVDDFEGSAPRAIKAAGGDIWSSYHLEVTEDSIRLAQELGLEVNVWTVNKKGRMRTLIEMGVDGIITDYPDRLREVAIEMGLPVPEPTPVDIN